jgi:hypothetical protein
MKTLQELRKAVETKTASILTVTYAQNLKGKRIATIYFGYHGQDGIDEFVVGEVKKEIYPNGKEGRVCLFTAEGRNTFIRAHEENKGIFTCSDIDRYVFFIEVHEN